MGKFNDDANFQEKLEKTAGFNTSQLASMSGLVHVPKHLGALLVESKEAYVQSWTKKEIRKKKRKELDAVMDDSDAFFRMFKSILRNTDIANVMWTKLQMIKRGSLSRILVSLKAVGFTIKLGPIPKLGAIQKIMVAKLAKDLNSWDDVFDLIEKDILEEGPLSKNEKVMNGYHILNLLQTQIDKAEI